MNRTLLIRADAVFLIVMSLFGLSADLMSYVSAAGPFADIFFSNPVVIGVVEAHGLALIAGVSALLSRPGIGPHANLAAIHLLLGSANIAFFDVFLNVNAGTMGVVVTAIHFGFAAAQFAALQRHRQHA